MSPAIPRIYLAARYSRRLELCAYREQLHAAGYKVQARWLDGQHQLSASGNPIGESGEALVESGSAEAAELRAKFALDDFSDVAMANIVISFTEPPRTASTNRGGRHVEFGIALANYTTRVIVVGHRENIFHWLDRVEFYANWQDCFASLSGGGAR